MDLAGVISQRMLQKKKKKGSLVQRIPKVISHKNANDISSCVLIHVLATILGPSQKVISHKCAKAIIGYTMIYVQANILGPL